MNVTNEGLLIRLKRSSRRIALLILLVVAAPVGSGCYGRFPLTHSVYEFNGEVSDNKIITNILFWIFVLLPVYYFAMLGDAVIFNLIEFWTGETLETGQTIQKGDRAITLTPANGGQEAVLTVTRNGRLLSQTRFVRTSETTCEIRDAQDRVEGTIVKGVDGSLTFASLDGKAPRTIPVSALAALRSM